MCDPVIQIKSKSRAGVLMRLLFFSIPPLVNLHINVQMCACSKSEERKKTQQQQNFSNNELRNQKNIYTFSIECDANIRLRQWFLPTPTHHSVNKTHVWFHTNDLMANSYISSISTFILFAHFFFFCYSIWSRFLLTCYSWIWRRLFVTLGKPKSVIYVLQ